MNDQDILDFINTQRPDFRSYYFNTMVPQGAENSEAGMLARSRQHLSEGHDLDQFNQFLASRGGGGTGTNQTLSAPNTTVPNTPIVPTAVTGLTPPPTGTDYVAAPAPSIGGNYRQDQNSNQAGQFSTIGTTAQNQSGSSSSTGQQTTTSSGSQQGTSGQAITGTSTSTPVDTLGFGQLLKDAAGSASANDAARNAFLTDVMQTGGTGFGSQIDQAIRQSLSGPGMQGVGDSARGRAAGYASAQIGRNNLDQRLSAAKDLAGPSALATLSTAANPYVGKTETNDSNVSGFSNLLTNGTQNVSSLANQLTNSSSVGTEASAGSTTGQASQSGAGTIPQGQPVKTGGCVLCTAAIELKLSKHHRVLRRVIKHKLHTDSDRFSAAARGYFAIFTPFAAWLLSHPRLARLLWPLAKAVVYEELRVSGRKLRWKPWAWTVHWTGHHICGTYGRLFPVKDYVDDERILSIARREQILFEMTS